MKSIVSSVKKPSTLLLFLSDFRELTKMGLSLSVVFSSVAGYLLGATQVDAQTLILLIVGGYGMVGASNTFNQIIEKDRDALMKRTQNRPLPAGRITVQNAFIIAVALTLLGITVLYLINFRTALFGLIAIFLYTLVYTPLKTRTPLSVLAGAFPGAIPFMLGWVAATGEFGIEAGALFMIQFFWQFPHFWAIGWMLDEDYKKAGFRMLPTGEKDNATLIQIILYTFWLLPVSILPVMGITGQLTLSVTGAALILLAGLGMLFFALRLYRRKDYPSARNLMLASVSYLTFMQLVYVLDKWLYL